MLEITGDGDLEGTNVNQTMLLSDVEKAFLQGELNRAAK